MSTKVLNESCELEKIKVSYKTAAKIVALYGVNYLPLFERIHAEIQKNENIADLKTLALKISKQIA